MLVKLMSCYDAMSQSIDSLQEQMQRAFCAHLAGIAVYASIHPLDNGWLFRFLVTVSKESREMWADEMRSVIGGLDSSAKLNLWQRWLKVYWQERLQGRPLPLNTKETAEMLEWAILLEPVFPDAVSLVLQSVYPDFGNSMVYYPLSHSELLTQYPDACVDLVAFLAAGEGARPIYDLHELSSAVERLISLIPSNPKLKSLCNDLARLGVPGVGELAAKLDVGAGRS
jgi:hypothetical protein